ncbi:MAG: hypothetical protein OXC12_20200 [Spirochaetaceae bacterium]|nr:hypothetical protein [Spirochaetaceae bacterium]
MAVPGSVLLLGEYAVTEPGAPGVAVALHPEVRATFDAGGPPRIAGQMGACRFTWTPAGCDSPLFAALVAECGPPTGSMSVDSSDFAGPHGKLGLGSSAAVAVAVAALLVTGRHRDARALAPDATASDAGRDDARRRVLAAALAAHRAAQGGRGSGYDVATSVWGGVVRFAGGPAPVVTPWRPRALPNLYLVQGADPLATPGAVARYEEWREREPGPAARFRERSRALVEQFLAAGGAKACCTAIEAGGELTRWLGERIGVAVEPTGLRDRLDRFRERGWVAKPVGAGGELGIAAAPAGTPPPALPYASPLRQAEGGMRWLTRQ